jgi:PBSX family phage terminase large subunit
MSDKQRPLSDKQIIALKECNARINVLEGAVRSGKSHIANLIFLEELRSGPKGEYLISGKNEGTIRRNIITPMNQMTGGIIRYNRTLGEFTIFDKKVYVVGANDERAEGKIRGVTLAGALIDEVTLLPESFFKMATSRLSIEHSKMICTTNPDGPYHWLKTDYIDRAGEINLKNFNFKLDDNPFLPKSYVNDLKKEYKGLWYKRFIEGLWVLAEGAIYDFFDNKLHTFRQPRTYAKQFLLGIDYGTTNAFAAVLVGFNDEAHPALWVEKEYYWDSKEKGFQKTDSEYALDLEKHFEGYPINLIYLDPSAASFEQELKRRKKPVKQANNDVIDGIRFVGSLIAQGDLMIVDKCKNLIKEIESYVWDSKSVRLGEDKPLKQRDHAVDAMRYVLYSHFGKRSTLAAKDPHEAYMQGQQRKWQQDPMAYQGYPGSQGWQRL